MPSGRTDQFLAALRLLALAADVEYLVEEVDVCAGQSEQLAPTQAPEGGEEYEKPEVSVPAADHRRGQPSQRHGAERRPNVVGQVALVPMKHG